ncbi:MAG: hypothetical protein GX751_06070 [Desulfuromonadaceae bacterium]|nr:hypothetical protein [Desulfuromonadaceae bacterium]
MRQKNQREKIVLNICSKTFANTPNNFDDSLGGKEKSRKRGMLGGKGPN